MKMYLIIAGVLIALLGALGAALWHIDRLGDKLEEAQAQAKFMTDAYESAVEGLRVLAQQRDAAIEQRDKRTKVITNAKHSSLDVELPRNLVDSLRR